MNNITVNEDGTFNFILNEHKFERCNISEIREIDLEYGRPTYDMNVKINFESSSLNKKKETILDFYWRLKELGYDTRNIYVVDTPIFLSKKDGKPRTIENHQFKNGIYKGHDYLNIFFKTWNFVYILINDSYTPFDNIIRYYVEN